MAKRRKHGDGSVRLRKDGRWEGRIVISYDEKGLPKTKNVLAKTKTECAVKLKELRERLEAELGGKQALRGLTVGTFHAVCLQHLPAKQLVGRAEAVKILNHALDRRAGERPASLPFTDVPKDHWAYDEIREAAVSHTYQKTDDGEKWLTYDR